jgi:ABC-type uncharacterized transport system auxiliary subunit
MNRIQISLVLALLTLLLSSCTSPKLPAVTAYTINIQATNKATGQKPQTQKVLRVAIPRSSAAIMSRNILYQGSGYSLNAYAFSKWSDTPNRMLANLFLTRIEDSVLFKAVLPADSRGNSDYVLESSIQQFHQHINKDGSSKANMRIGFYLIEARTGKVLATREFISAHQAISTNAEGAVSALNHASVAISSDLITWLSSLQLN